VSKRPKPDRFRKMAERICVKWFKPTKNNIVPCECIELEKLLRRVDRAAYKRGLRAGHYIEGTIAETSCADSTGYFPPDEKGNR
jgi:hypothetical protein